MESPITCCWVLQQKNSATRQHAQRFLFFFFIFVYDAHDDANNIICCRQLLLADGKFQFLIVYLGVIFFFVALIDRWCLFVTVTVSPPLRSLRGCWWWMNEWMNERMQQKEEEENHPPLSVCLIMLLRCARTKRVDRARRSSPKGLFLYLATIFYTAPRC